MAKLFGIECDISGQLL